MHAKISTQLFHLLTDLLFHLHLLTDFRLEKIITFYFINLIQTCNGGTPGQINLIHHVFIWSEDFA